VTEDKLRSEGWQTGRRVSREDTKELGTITEADGEIKVKWDNGRTSYFGRTVPSNVKLVEL
jgi:hypothetical protein